MSAIYSNGGNRWNILGFNFTKRDVLSSVYKISMEKTHDFQQSVDSLFSHGPIARIGPTFSEVKALKPVFHFNRNVP
jgi:hypothetical protein